ncbi:alpha/beta-hydrolase [Mollisia scopiformis]|uniref:Alpha/beta-hydrolase n=1 Tax=Mollisia scopiformis TaxID=149040 RepID=A0A132B5T2_MOLSC|nr:alpha/beta-hydrolase [Mollisia scopiformis]KUJ07701.1 alpha/beta-hydrolase [Mollisia scopiformis]
MSSKRVEFTTFDGTILRGDLYKAEAKDAGVVVMTQGLSLLKEHFVDEIAKRFQAAGIAALVYDHRGWGSSEGSPQFETDPLQQAADYHDAITFAVSLQASSQKPRVAIWEIGHSGGASMIAGNDPRLSAVILVMPFTSGARDAAAFPAGILDKAWSNRADTAAAWMSGSTPDVEYVTLWADSEANGMGEGPQRFLTGTAAYDFITTARLRSDRAGTPSENKLSLQSFYHIANIEPADYISKIAPRALLYLAATTDALTGPLETHKEVFSHAAEPKEFVILNNHHLANYFGEDFETNVGKQIEFLKRHL